MAKIKYMLLNFINETDGVETIEWIALVVVAAVLIGIIASIGSNIADNVQGEATSATGSLTTSYSTINGAQRGY